MCSPGRRTCLDICLVCYSIGYDAFAYCSSLTSIEIPDSVTSIDYSAFYLCSSLKDVYYTGTKEQWKKISIGSDNSCLTSATIHYNSKMPNSSGLALPNYSTATIANCLAPIPTNTKTIVVSKSTAKEYTGLVQNGRYIFMLVKSDKAENLISSDNLVYIDQFTADENGVLNAGYPNTYENEYTALIFGGKIIADTTTEDTDSDTDTKTDVDTDSEKSSDTEKDTDTPKDTDTEKDTDTPKDTDTEKDTDTPKDTDTKKDTDTPKDTDTKKDTDTPKDTDTEKDTDTPKDTDTEKDTDTPKDTDTEKDTDTPKDTDTEKDTDTPKDTDTEKDTDTPKDTDTDKEPDKKPTTPDKPKDPTPTGTMGDLDGDGKITSADSLLILRQSVSLEHFTDFQQKLADVDGDGKITSADALEVLRYSVNLPTTGNIGKTITE